MSADVTSQRDNQRLHHVHLHILDLHYYCRIDSPAFTKYHVLFLFLDCTVGPLTISRFKLKAGAHLHIYAL